MTFANITIFLVGGFISALITFFFTNIANRNAVKEIVKEVIALHERIYHITSPEKELKIHVESCQANKKIDRIEKSLIYIVSQLGGDPKELGLIDL